MDQQPWYQDGLRFQCTQCGDCCSGAPGYVWLRPEDTQRLAAALELEVDDFLARYTRQVGARTSLIELSNHDCVFWDRPTRRCAVYEHRPLQCRTWPFWESNLITPQAWIRTCRVCPGSGQGSLVPLEQIRQQAAAMKL